MRTKHHIICPACQHEFSVDELDDVNQMMQSEARTNTPTGRQRACAPAHEHMHAGVHTSPSSLRSEEDTGVGAQMHTPTHARRDKIPTFLSQFPMGFRQDKEFRQVWKDFIQFRKQKHKQLTQLGATRIINKLKELPVHDVVAQINKSIENSWTGIFPVKRQFDADETSSGAKPTEDQKRDFYHGAEEDTAE